MIGLSSYSRQSMVFDQTRQPCGPRFWRFSQSSENGNRRQSTPPGSLVQSGVGFPASRHRSRIWWTPRAPVLDQPRPKEGVGDPRVLRQHSSGGGHIPIGRELGRIPDRDAIMVHADLGGGRPGVVAVDDGVDDRFPHGLPWHGEGLGAPDVFPGHQSQRVFRAEQVEHAVHLCEQVASHHVPKEQLGTPEVADRDVTIP